MLMGTSMSLSERRCAVTTISSRPPPDAVSASPAAARVVAGHARGPIKAIVHPHRLIVFERIAHPLKCRLFPTNEAFILFWFLWPSVRKEAGLTLELSASVNGGSRKLTV